jgi:translocation and assembly module TamB
LRADVEIAGLRATDIHRAGRVIELSRVRMRLSPLQALAGGLQIERLELEGPEINWALDRPSRAPTVSPAPKTCWLQTLRLVHLDYLRIAGGQVALSMGEDHLSLRAVALESTRASGNYRVRLQAEGGLSLASLGEPIAVNLLAADFTLQPNASRATIKNTVIDVDGLELTAEGTVDDLCHPVPDLSVSAKADVARWSHLLLPRVPDPKGKVEVTGRVFTGKDKVQATVTAHLSGVALAGYRLPETDLNARMDGTHLTVDRAHLAMDKGTVDARGEVGFSGKFPISVDAELKGVTFAPTVDRLLLRHSHVDFRADIRARMSGQLKSFAMAGDAEGDIDDFAVDDEAWDHSGPKERILSIPPTVHMTSGMRVDGEKFRFEHAVFRSPESEVDANASVYYDGNKGLKLTADLPRVSLTELRAIAGLPWRGRGAVKASIIGPYDNLRVEGEIDLAEFALASVDFGAVRGPLVFHGGVLEVGGEDCRIGVTDYWVKGSVDFGHELLTEAEIRTEDGRLEDLLFAVEDLAPALHQARVVLRGSAKGQGHIHGPFLHADAEIRLSASSFDLFQRRFGAGTLSADLHAGRLITVHELGAQVGEGTIGLSGTVTTDWSVALQAKASRVPLGVLLQTPDGSKPPIATGLITAEGAIGGTLSDLEPAGKLTMSNLALFGFPLGKANMDVTTERGLLRFSGAAGDELTASGSIRLIGDGPFEAVVRGETRHLESYLAGAGYKDPPGGALSGEASLRGEFLAPEASEVDVTLAHLEVSKRHLKLSSDGPVTIRLRRGALSLAPTVLVGVHSRIEVGGSVSADDILETSLSGDLDIRLLEGFLPQVERLSGLLHLGASLHGPRNAPLVVGSAKLTGGQFSWVGLPLTARKVDGTAQFSHREVLLSDLHGELNGGEATLAGEASLDGFHVSRYELSADLSSVPLRIPDSIPSKVRGRLTLSGDADRDLTLGGEVHIEYARFNQAMDLDAALERFRLKPGTVGALDVQDLDVGQALRALDRRRAAPLRFDVRLLADGDIRVENNAIQLPLNGDVRLTGTVDSPGLIGRLDGRDGLAEFRGHQYHVTQALFSFDDRDRIAPSFDVSADTDARQYRVFVRLFGNAQDYKLQLRSQPALTEDDIVKLMTFGVTSQDVAGLGGAGSLGKASYLGDVLWNVSGLHDQVRRVIPHNQVIRDLSVNLGSAYIQATGQVEPVAQIESRVLTDNLKLRAQLPLSEPTGKRAEAEYQLNDHLSLQAEWNNDYSDYSVGDFGMDMRARWEFGE